MHFYIIRLQSASLEYRECRCAEMLRLQVGLLLGRLERSGLVQLDHDDRTLAPQKGS